MGQYYRVVVKDGEHLFVNDRKLMYNRNSKPYGYVMAKLLEHSWLNNDFMDSVCKFIHNRKVRIIWCGDYADDNDLRKLTNDEIGINDVWDKDNSKVHRCDFFKERFGYCGKFLVNHTKKVYVSFNHYKKNTKKSYGIGHIHPLSLLTALGNGQGGGDYFSQNNKEYVGSWAWDEISIEDKAPSGFSEVSVSFWECPQ